MTGKEGEREPEEPSELHRFLDLARKLVRVPREEIDAERSKEEQRKQDERRHSLPVSPAYVSRRPVTVPTTARRTECPVAVDHAVFTGARPGLLELRLDVPFKALARRHVAGQAHPLRSHMLTRDRLTCAVPWALVMRQRSR